MSPVTQPFPIGTVGNLCPLIIQKEPREGYQCQRSQPVNLGEHKGARWPILLVQAWRRRPWVPTPLEPHVQEFLRGEEMLPASPGVGEWLPMNLNAWTFPLGECKVDKVVCTTARHPSLVVGTQGGPQPRQSSGVCMEGAGIFPGVQSMMPCIEGGQWPHHTAGSPLSRQGPIPAPSGHAVQ